jgi:hypothetical protein
LLVCDEVGTVYPDPKNLEATLYPGTKVFEDVCPNCKIAPLSEFLDASADEIQDAGFQRGEYR